MIRYYNAQKKKNVKNMIRYYNENMIRYYNAQKLV